MELGKSFVPDCIALPARGMSSLLGSVLTPSACATKLARDSSARIPALHSQRSVKEWVKIENIFAYRSRRASRSLIHRENDAAQLPPRFPGIRLAASACYEILRFSLLFKQTRREVSVIRLSRRQLLVGAPLAAFGAAAMSGLPVGNLVPAATAASSKTESPETELEDFTFDIEKDGKAWTGPGVRPRNTGSEPLRRLILFNAPTYEDLAYFVVNDQSAPTRGRPFRIGP
jgi:hypothetical protein